VNIYLLYIVGKYENFQSNSEVRKVKIMHRHDLYGTTANLTMYEKCIMLELNV
jgi:hypothetical protein